MCFVQYSGCIIGISTGWFIKAETLVELVQEYPKINFSVIVDNFEIVDVLSKLGQDNDQTFKLYIDINTGMNRTGIDFRSDWEDLV